MINQNSPLYAFVEYQQGLEDQVATLTDEVNASNGKITDLTNQLNAASEQVSTLQSNVAALQQMVDALKANPSMTPNQINAQRILGVALTHNDMRTPYVFGAEWQNNKAFDCSSFTQYCYHVGAGIDIPRNKQYNYDGIEVQFENLQPADLLFYDFQHDGVTDHVAMYLGDGKIIQTNTPKSGINIQDAATWSRGSLVKIWRILK